MSTRKKMVLSEAKELEIPVITSRSSAGCRAHTSNDNDISKLFVVSSATKTADTISTNAEKAKFRATTSSKSKLNSLKPDKRRDMATILSPDNYKVRPQKESSKKKLNATLIKAQSNETKKRGNISFMPGDKSENITIILSPKNYRVQPTTNQVETFQAKSKSRTRRKYIKPFDDRPSHIVSNFGPSYEIKPINPAKKRELIPVAKAMHRGEFAPRLQSLFQPETDAALDAIHTGVYIGWRCHGFTWDCIRLSQQSRCFCDHNLNQHSPYSGKTIRVKCLVNKCSCKAFTFIPERPEDIGEWWLQKRPHFDVRVWRAKCRCKHTHVQHDPSSRRCTMRGCACFVFDSNFLCAACDRHWEDHETCFDNVNSRRDKRLSYGEEYLPFYEMPDLRNICLNGEESDSAMYNTITSGPNAIPRYNPTTLSLELARDGRVRKT